MSSVVPRSTMQDQRKKDEWDKAQRMPSTPDSYKRCFARKTKIYNVEQGQFFQRNQDGLLVEVDYISKSGLVLAVDVRTREVYSTFEIEFSTKEQKWDGIRDEWYDVCLVWMRVSKEEARKIRLNYTKELLCKAFRAAVRFFR